MIPFIGGSSIGGPTYGSGTLTKNFDNLPPGIIRGFWAKIACTLISTGTAFASNILTGSSLSTESAVGDDLDAWMVKLFASMDLDLGDGRVPFKGAGMDRVRSLIVGLTGQDVITTGGLVSGTSIPVSTGTPLASAAYLYVPLATPFISEDLDSCKQGSYSIARGAMRWQGNNATSVALKNGTATIASVTIDVRPDVEPGIPTYIGPYWEAQDRNNLGNNRPPLERAMRLLVLDTATAYTGTYDVDYPNYVNNIDVTQFQNWYQYHRETPLNGPAFHSRLVPIVFLRRGQNVQDMDPSGLPPIIFARTASSLHLVDVMLRTNVSASAQMVAGTNLKSSSGYTVAPVLPRSAAASGQSRAVPKVFLPFLGKVLMPGQNASVGEVHGGPSTFSSSSALACRC